MRRKMIFAAAVLALAGTAALAQESIPQNMPSKSRPGDACGRFFPDDTPDIDENGQPIGKNFQ